VCSARLETGAAFLRGRVLAGASLGCNSNAEAEIQRGAAADAEKSGEWQTDQA
jgi:hypothetical protein